MKNWKLALQLVAGIATSLGTGIVVQNIVLATIPVTASKTQRMLAGWGGFVMASIAADYTTEYVVKQIEEILTPLVEKPHVEEEPEKVQE